MTTDAPKTDDTDATDDQEIKQAPGRSSAMAFNGRRVSTNDYPEEAVVPQFPVNLAVDSLYDLSRNDSLEDEGSIEDLHSVNIAMVRARRALNAVQRALISAQRQLVTAEVTYRHANAKALIGVTGGTEKQRSAVADLATEELYSNLLVKRAVVDEVVSLVRSINHDIDAITVISHNVRAQMTMQ